MATYHAGGGLPEGHDPPPGAGATDPPLDNPNDDLEQGDDGQSGDGEGAGPVDPELLSLARIGQHHRNWVAFVEAQGQWVRVFLNSKGVDTDSLAILETFPTEPGKLFDLWGGLDKCREEAQSGGRPHGQGRGGAGPDPRPPIGMPRDLSILLVFSGEQGQRAELWFKDYNVICGAINLDPMRFLPLQLSYAKPT